MMQDFMLKPNCGVLLAAYNGMHYIEEQINTILHQIDVNVTLYISVDLSIDGTEEYIKLRCIQDNRLILLPHGEKYGGASKNFFRLIRDVDLLKHDYFAFSDQDDIWFVDKLKRAISKIKSNGFDAYSSNVIAFWPNGFEKKIIKSHPQKHWDYFFESAGPGCTYVLKNTLLQKIKENIMQNWKLVQKINMHDWYCYAYARFHGYQWYIDPTPSTRYRQHSSNQLGVNYGLKAYRIRLNQLLNGLWLSQVCLAAQIISQEKVCFIKSVSQFDRMQFIKLAVLSFQCRRNWKDALFFQIICILLFFKGIKFQN